jgi:hypothetical protein
MKDILKYNYEHPHFPPIVVHDYFEEKFLYNIIIQFQDLNFYVAEKNNLNSNSQYYNNLRLSFEKKSRNKKIF